MKYPLCNYTHYSLLKGFSKPKQLSKKCAENEYVACGISDYKSISGAVSFHKSCQDNGIKPIIGCSFDHYTLFARNKQGWFDLIEIVSSLDKDGNEDKAIITKIGERGNLICLLDNVDSNMSNSNNYPVNNTLLTFRQNPLTSPSHYVEQADAHLHRILLCSAMKTTLPKVNTLLRSGNLEQNEEFFLKDTFYVKSKDEMPDDEYGEQSLEQIYNLCEDYEILNPPMLPKFPTPTGESEEEYLKSLARKGWIKFLHNTGKVEKEEDKQKYLDRFTMEFDVIKQANLFGYFLIVQDIIRYVKSQGWLSGPGRGSAAGCLISYIVEITEIDPIEFDLLFERFFNAARTDALPDIDMDVPANKRDDIIEYLKNTYGKDNVSQMLTFGRLQGRSAVKEVLRVSDVCGFGEMNEITSHIADEAAISDQLQEMDEEDRSIIRWSLVNNADDLRDFCFINEDGKLDGDYAEFFDQAIQIEGTFKTQGKHPAGVVISAEPLYKVCPMVNQKSGGEKIAGLEMADLEALGHVKFDVLGLTLLDKIMRIEELING
jgi:DNA polymerase-3 subunit alpha